MKDLVPTTRIELGRTSQTKEIYESFYFRGNLINSSLSFWLKHNLIQFNGEDQVRIDNTFVVFDDNSQTTQTFHQSTVLSCEAYHRQLLSPGHTWQNLRIEFNGGGFFELTPEGRLTGIINDERQSRQIHWNLQTVASGGAYYHFDQSWFYRNFFPKKKLLTVDCRMQFKGEINSPTFKASGTFIGMNGHNWGKEHAHLYAYANCNEFLNSTGSSTDAVLECFSAKIKIGGILSPYLSAGSLLFDEKWYHFNSVIKSWRPQVRQLTSRNYDVEFENTEYQLHVEIDANHHAYAELNYDHPSRKTSRIGNAKHATGTVILIRKYDQREMVRLTSNRFEFEGTLNSSVVL